ncbi:MAG: DCC1-like thiol-disulfide oxidoreductase family protein [Polyangiales bacterium]
MTEPVPQSPSEQRPTSASAAQPEGKAIVLFDGVCNLCNSTVQIIIDHDPAGYFRFASLQSEKAKELLARFGMKPPEGDPDSILLIQDGELYSHSGAALRIARRMTGAYKLFWATIVVPWFIRDLVYRFIARNRYRWFGREEACRVPTPELRARFL